MLPFYFSKTQGVLYHPSDENEPQLWIHENTTLDAISEARRQINHPVKIVNVTQDEFNAQLQTDLSKRLFQRDAGNGRN
jgi:hypothetical protein